MEDWKRAYDDGRHISVILMDLSKAFDCMPHSLLIAKLHAYGMGRQAVEIFASYLTGRFQRVKLQTAESEWVQSIKGVPQGSILGPILFNIFLNDLFGFIKKADLSNYADDNQLSSVHKDLNSAIDMSRSESELAVEWFSNNHMEANASKFHHMLISPSNSVPDYELVIDNSVIERESFVKLLGVHFDENLNFSKHIDELCKKTGNQLNVLSRLSSNLDHKSRLCIFRCFILSYFSYCSNVWFFCGKTGAKRLEAIHERALRFVSQDFESSYELLLTNTGFPSLELRRTRSLACTMYRIRNNLAPSYVCELFSERTCNYNLRTNHDQEFSVPHVNKTRTGLHSLRYFGAKLWNSLPSDLVESKDLNHFKFQIKSWEGFACECPSCVRVLF